MQLIDLLHLGRKCVIGSWRVGDVVIDPGPASCCSTLLEALGGQPPRVLALTHIHLDHAGATGSLLRRFPDIEVWVHERGAPHLIDPTKLLASASRLYGDDMERLWGEVLPVPAERVRALSGEEMLPGFRVAYTPGHASHHVSYLHEDSGQVFSGDVTGVRIGQAGPVLAPTPPPDIDVELWLQSLRTIESWGASALAPTHFGVYTDVQWHLSELRSSLERSSGFAATLTEDQFAEVLRAEIAARADSDTLEAYGQAMPAGQSYQGLRRYLHKRG